MFSLEYMLYRILSRKKGLSTSKNGLLQVPNDKTHEHASDLIKEPVLIVIILERKIYIRRQ